MGLGLAPNLTAAKLVPQSRPFYGFTTTPKYFYVSCQRHFSFPAWQDFSIRMHLNIYVYQGPWSALQSSSFFLWHLMRWRVLPYYGLYIWSLSILFSCFSPAQCLTPVNCFAPAKYVILAGLHIFFPEHFMQKKRLPIKVYAFDPVEPIRERIYEYRLFSPAVTITQRISQAGKTFTPYSGHWFWWCGSSSFWPSVSHAGESPTYQVLRIWFFGYIELSCGRERLLAKKILVTFAHYAVLNQST